MLLREPGNNLSIKSSDHGEKTTCVLTSARLPRFSWPLTCPIRWPQEQSRSPGAASRPEGTWVQGISGLTQPWSQPAQPQTSRRQGAAAEARRQQEPLGLTGQRRPAAMCRPANRGGGGRAARAGQEVDQGPPTLSSEPSGRSLGLGPFRVLWPSSPAQGQLPGSTRRKHAARARVRLQEAVAPHTSEDRALGLCGWQGGRRGGRGLGRQRPRAEASQSEGGGCPRLVCLRLVGSPAEGAA